MFLSAVVVVLITADRKERKRRGSARLALSRRIEHRCKEAVGLEEKKLHSAICRCLSDMMDSREV